MGFCVSVLCGGSTARPHGPPPVFMNKMLLAHRHTLCFHVVWGCLPAGMAGVSVEVETTRPADPQIFAVWPFTEQACPCMSKHLTSFDVPQWPYEVHSDGFHLIDEKGEIECKKLDPKPYTGKGQATTTTHTS